MNLSKRPMGVVLCLLALTSAACSTTGKGDETSGGPGSTEATATTVEGDGPSPAPTPPKPTTPAPPKTTTTAPPEVATIEVVESGFSEYRVYDEEIVASAGAVIENTSKSDAVFFEVVFNFLDTKGKPVATQTATVYYVAAGEKGHAIVDYVELNGRVDSIEVTAVVPEQAYLDGATLPLDVDSVDKEEFTDAALVKGTATNDTDDVLDGYSLSCVLRVKKKIVGGARGRLDSISPGQTVAWEARGSVAADSAECSASSAI